MRAETFEEWAERKGIADDPFGFIAAGCDGRVTIEEGVVTAEDSPAMVATPNPRNPIAPCSTHQYHAVCLRCSYVIVADGGGEWAHLGTLAAQCGVSA